MTFNLKYLLLPLSIMVCISENYINAIEMDNNINNNIVNPAVISDLKQSVKSFFSLITDSIDANEILQNYNMLYDNNITINVFRNNRRKMVKVLSKSLKLLNNNYKGIVSSNFNNHDFEANKNNMLNLINFSYDNNNENITTMQYNRYKDLFKESMKNVIYKMYNFIFNDNQYVNYGKHNISMLATMNNLFYNEQNPRINANEYKLMLEWLLYCNLNRLILYFKNAHGSIEQILKSFHSDTPLPLFKRRNFINAPNNHSTQYGVIIESIKLSLHHLIKLNIYNTYNNNGHKIKINDFFNITDNIRKILANDISEILFREYNMSVPDKNNIETELFNNSKFYMRKFSLLEIFDKVMSSFVNQIEDEHSDKIIENYNDFIASGFINLTIQNI